MSVWGGGGARAAPGDSEDRRRGMGEPLLGFDAPTPHSCVPLVTPRLCDGSP